MIVFPHNKITFLLVHHTFFRETLIIIGDEIIVDVRKAVYEVVHFTVFQSYKNSDDYYGKVSLEANVCYVAVDGFTDSVFFSHGNSFTLF